MRDDLKLDRIKALIMRLNEGYDIPRKDLQRVLTKNELEELDLSWQREKKETIEKPKDILRYEQLLKTANLHYSRYESMISHKHDEIKTRSMMHLAEKKYELAIELACEIVGSEKYKIIWFDRNVFESQPCPSGMPRIITSRSNDNNFKGYSTSILGRKTKREYKLLALNIALEKLEPQEEVDPTDLYNAVILNNNNEQNRDFSDFKFEE
jgi:hypothetical protein